MIKFKKTLPAINNLYIVPWPQVCVSCGSEGIDDVKPNQVAIQAYKTSESSGVFTDTKKTVVTTAYARLFLCQECRRLILAANKLESKGFRGHGGLAQKLKADPYRQFIMMNDNGRLWVAEGPFGERLKAMIPMYIAGSGKNPIVELGEKMPKGVEISSIGQDEIQSWPPPDDDELDIMQDPEDTAHLRRLTQEDPFNPVNWLNLARHLVASGRVEAAARLVDPAHLYLGTSAAFVLANVIDEESKKKSE